MLPIQLLSLLNFCWLKNEKYTRIYTVYVIFHAKISALYVTLGAVHGSVRPGSRSTRVPAQGLRLRAAQRVSRHHSQRFSQPPLTGAYGEAQRFVITNSRGILN